MVDFTPLDPSDEFPGEASGPRVPEPLFLASLLQPRVKAKAARAVRQILFMGERPEPKDQLSKRISVDPSVSLFQR
jgi:hypothetical protein